MPIKHLHARQILDANGTPTLEVDLITDLGLFRSPVPSDIPNSRAAVQLKDGEPLQYNGQGVLRAVTKVNEIIGPALQKSTFEVTQQRQIDEFLIRLDGTPNKSNLGANAILGVSLVVAKAGAAQRGIPLYRHFADLAGNNNLIIPTPAFSIIGGGAISCNNIPIEDIMILPTGAHSFQNAVRIISDIKPHLEHILERKCGAQGKTVNVKGAYTPNIEMKEAFACIANAIGKAGYTGRVDLAIDSVGSKLFKTGQYDLDFKNPKSDPKQWLSFQKLEETYVEFMKKFSVVSIEDPYYYEHLEAWNKLLENNPTLQVVGDELTLSDPHKIQEAVNANACNCVLIRVSQIGTITEAIDAHLTAKMNGLSSMVADSLNETEDTFCADLAVGLGIGQIKIGGTCRSDRVSKANQLLRIEEELGTKAMYAGKAFHRPM